MKKNEFLLELKERLVGLSETDMKQSLDYYTEMIDDRMEDGCSEEEAIAEVGTPAMIAEDILKEMPLAKLVKVRVKPNRRMGAWEVVLLILGSPLWISLLLTAFAVVLTLYIVIWAVIICLWTAEAAIGAAALGLSVILVKSFVEGYLWAGFHMIGEALLLAGLAIFGFYGCLYLSKRLCLLSKKLFVGVKRCFIRKEAIR